MRKVANIEEKFIIILLLIVFSGAFGFSQAKKPTIMLVPSDAWCIENGYMLSFDHQGLRLMQPDYITALQERSDLQLVISKINELMVERGFPLKNLELTLLTVANESAVYSKFSSQRDYDTDENSIDKMRRFAKADIWIQLTWSVIKLGPKISVTFNLHAFDAYTNKLVASSTGTGPHSFIVELPALLEEAVLSHLDYFNSQLQSHFEDMLVNGREIIVKIKVGNVFDGNLDSDFDGLVLGEVIENWVSDNTVNNRYIKNDATGCIMLFEQVRIPIYNSNAIAIDARAWGQELRKFLKQKYSIESRVMTKGLGEVTVIIGDK